MRYLFTITFLVLFELGAFPQALSIDTTFQPFFDIRCCGSFGGRISDLWEDPTNGKLFIVGDFRFGTANKETHLGITSMSRDGSRNYQFKGCCNVGMDAFGKIVERPGNSLMLSMPGGYVQIDKSGKLFNKQQQWQWVSNKRKTFECNPIAYNPYFFFNGATLNTIPKSPVPNSCGIITPTDTFPHRYLVKIDSMGYWDSSFKKDANHAVQGFVPYDSNRLFVQGLSRAFTHYDGVRVNGLCRIYEDGSLDTTFQLLQTTNFGNFTLPVDVQEDGSFFLYGGGYSLMNYPNIQFKIAKFHADGSLDTSFRSHHNLKDISGGSTQINSLVSTLDGGYIITGMFDSIQGYAKHNLAKLDSLGNVEPQYFTTHGPDTSHWQGGGYEYVKIKKSVFGGYYVYGDFISWDGKAVQPIVRLKDLTVGIPKQKHKKLEAAIYPNPSKGQVKVVAKVKLQGIAVYNLQGQLVQQINPKKRSWELPDKSGMYLIRITDENGNYFTEKIIKN